MSYKLVEAQTAPEDSQALINTRDAAIAHEMFNFTALLGAHSASPASQSLLELDGGVKILVDVGWDEAFDADKLKALEKHVSTISLILLTHPTIDHIGAFAHCCKHVPQFARIPCYATTPVINLGRTLLTDLYASSPLSASIIPESSLAEVSYNASARDANILLQPPTAAEIASYFAQINPLKYSQPHQPIPSPFSPPLGGLVITAYAAGHTLGGTIWHLQHGTESIVYATDWNQGKENLLSGAAWLAGGSTEVIEQLRRPTALICSSKGTEKAGLGGGNRKQREDTIIALVRDTIAQGGKVLIPTDSSARVLELAYLLNETWRENIEGPHADVYRNAKIYMASRSASSTIRYTQSMVEWMEDSLAQSVEAAMTRRGNIHPSRMAEAAPTNTSNPLDFRFIRPVERKSKVERALAGTKPCIMLASDASLEWGFSRDALQALADDPKNLVILTEHVTKPEGGKGAIGSRLWELYEQQTADQESAHVVKLDGSSLELEQVSVERLEGDETTLYQSYLARQRQMHSTSQGDNTLTREDAAEIADDRSSTTSESSEDEDEEMQGRALNLSAQLTHNKRKLGPVNDAEVGINILLLHKNVHDYDVRNKRGREKMFPFATHRSRDDDFGDVIKPEDYLRAEERDEIDGQDIRDGTKNETGVGQKRKWDDVTTPDIRARRGSKGQNKRSKTQKDAVDAAIAAATGADVEMNGDAEDSESEESDYEPDEPTVEGPMKAVFRKQTLPLNLRLSYVDFSGLYDKRDLGNLLPRIRPRKLILIVGEQNETMALAEECRAWMGADSGADVYTPAVGEVIDASVDTNAWTLKLSRQLVKKLTWQNVRGLGIVALTGRMDTERTDEVQTEDDNVKKKLKMIKGEDDTASPEPSAKPDVVSTPVLDLLTSASTSSAPQLITQPVHVGDLRIADLRRLLQASGHTAELKGLGTLLVDGSVIVRKSGDGRIEVEGGGFLRSRRGDGAFYAVKKQIYDGLAVVAGV